MNNNLRSVLVGNDEALGTDSVGRSGIKEGVCPSSENVQLDHDSTNTKISESIRTTTLEYRFTSWSVLALFLTNGMVKRANSPSAVPS